MQDKKRHLNIYLIEIVYFIFNWTLLVLYLCTLEDLKKLCGSWIRNYACFPLDGELSIYWLEEAQFL